MRHERQKTWDRQTHRMSVACLSIRRWGCDVRLLREVKLCSMIWWVLLWNMRDNKEQSGKMKNNGLGQYLNHEGLDFDMRSLYIRGTGLKSSGLTLTPLVFQVVLSSVGPHEKTSSVRTGLMPIQRSRQGGVNHISTTWGMWLTDWRLSTTNHNSFSFLCPHKASVFSLTSHPISQENIDLPISEPVDSTVNGNSTNVVCTY